MSRRNNAFLSTHNSNNANIFPIIRQTFENFHHSKTMSNVFSDKKLINSMCQLPNLEHVLCKSKFMPIEENFCVNSGCNKWQTLRMYIPQRDKFLILCLFICFCVESM